MKELLLPTILLAGCSLPQEPLRRFGDANQNAQSVSLIHLIATPSLYQGQLVRVIGYGKIEFEGTKICLHREDIEAGISENCLWMSIDHKALGSKNGKYMYVSPRHMLVEGVFDREETGHGGLNSGSIHSINRLEEWRVD